MANRIKYQYVYLVGLDTDSPAYKIGYASNVNRRLKSLQTSCPYPLKLIKTIRTHAPRHVESELHNKLADYRMVGEWFNAPLDVMLSAIDEFKENESFFRWCYVLKSFGIRFNIVDDKSIRLPKEKIKMIFCDYEPDKQGMIEFGDISSNSGQAHIVFTSMPYVTKKRTQYQSSIFLHVFAGGFCDVYHCTVCDMDFSRYSKRKVHPVYGRYRFFRRASLYLESGLLKMSCQSSDLTGRFYAACRDAMSLELEMVKEELNV